MRGYGEERRGGAGRIEEKQRRGNAEPEIRKKRKEIKRGEGRNWQKKEERE